MKKNFQFIFFILLIGMLIGTMLSMLIASVLPDGVVKDFFLTSQPFGFGAAPQNWVEFGFLRLKIGLFFDISIVSIIGLFVSWYILRYFK